MRRRNQHQYGKTVVVYTFIRDFIALEGYAPSLREIALGCRLGASQTLLHLRRLTDWGLICREAGKVRSIILVDPRQDAFRNQGRGAISEGRKYASVTSQPVLQG